MLLYKYMGLVGDQYFKTYRRSLLGVDGEDIKIKKAETGFRAILHKSRLDKTLFMELLVCSSSLFRIFTCCGIPEQCPELPYHCQRTKVSKPHECSAAFEPGPILHPLFDSIRAKNRTGSAGKVNGCCSSPTFVSHQSRQSDFPPGCDRSQMMSST